MFPLPTGAFYGLAEYKKKDCCLNLLFVPRGRSPPGGEWFSGWSRDSHLTHGHCAETPPDVLLCACPGTAIPQLSTRGYVLTPLLPLQRGLGWT